MAGFHWLNTEQWQQVAVVQKFKRVSCHFKDCLLQSAGRRPQAGVRRPDIEAQTTSNRREQKQFGRRGPEEGATAGER